MNRIKLYCLIFAFTCCLMFAAIYLLSYLGKLESGRPILRANPGKKGHTYSIDIRKGEFAYLKLEQIDLDVALELTDPQKQTIFTHDTYQGRLGVEVIAFIAKQSGAYTLKLTAKPEDEGKYRLSLYGPRIPQANDHDRATASLNMEAARKAQANKDWQQAESKLKAAGKAWASAIEPVQEAVAIWEEAAMWKKAEQYDRCFDAYKVAENKLASTSAWVLHGELLNSIGTAYIKQCRFDEARNAFDFALDIYRQDSLHRARTLQNLAFAYRFVGAFETAIKYLKDAEKIHIEVGTRQSRAKWNDHMGTAYLKRGEADLAIYYLEKSARIGGQDHKKLISTRLAQAYILKKNYERALDLCNKLLREIPASRESWRLPLLYYRGVTFRHKQAYEQALADLDIVVAGSRNDALFYALLDRARARAGAGDKKHALEDVKAALDLLEQARATVLSPVLKQNYLAFRYECVAFLVDLAMSLDNEQAQQVLVRQDRFRAMSLLESLPVIPSDAESEPERRLIRQLIDAEWERAKTGLKVKKEFLAEKIDSLLIEYDRVRSRTVVQPDAISGLDLAAMQALLDDQDLLLFYAMGEQNTWLLVLDTHRVASFNLGPSQEIEDLLLDFVDDVGSRAVKRHQKGVATGRRQLASLLLRPELFDATTKRLIIIADGVLHRLPFAALSEPETGDALITHFEITYLSSMATLKALRDREQLRSRTANEPFTVFANPTSTGLYSNLPYAKKEAAQIKRLALNAVVYTGPEANKQQALSGVLNKSRLIHFCTHGLRHPEHPELSALILAEADSERSSIDPFLRVQEIAGLDLSAELVVLSACETGLGKPVRGEGLVGLTQAFLSAGATSIMVSLWRVDDQATVFLMQEFYANLSKNRPVKALQMAQKTMSQHEDWSAPYYWAGFRLMGDWRVQPGQSMSAK